MKWYFALNQRSLELQRSYWQRLIKAALFSARAHTDFAPHLLYDGDLDDPFLHKLRAHGVVVRRHRVSFYDALARHAADDDLWLTIASGAYLRTEIPLIEADEVVLYTDCDVVFTGPGAPPRPEVFACSPEFDRADLTNFNTGVMVMNLTALRRDIDAFRDAIIADLGAFATFDQDAYRSFYAGRVERLPDAWNWRPYWGVDPDARIVHFHGVKPEAARREIEGGDCGMRNLFDWSPEGYRTYVPEWERYAAEGYAAFNGQPWPGR